jgi:hypothetical protein
MSFQVYVLWFKNADPASQNDYHWSLFIAPVRSWKGVKYDTVSSTNVSGTLEWNYSHLPGYTMRQSQRRSSFGNYQRGGRVQAFDAGNSVAKARGELPHMGPKDGPEGCWHGCFARECDGSSWVSSRPALMKYGSIGKLCSNPLLTSQACLNKYSK